MRTKRQEKQLASLKAKMGDGDFLRAIYILFRSDFSESSCPDHLHDMLTAMDYYRTIINGE